MTCILGTSLSISRTQVTLNTLLLTPCHYRSLTEEDIDYLARNLVAFFRRDMKKSLAPRLSSWVPPDTNISEFADVIRRVVDPFSKNPSKKYFRYSLARALPTAAIQNGSATSMIYFKRRLSILKEWADRSIKICSSETAAPFMERWMAKRLGHPA